MPTTTTFDMHCCCNPPECCCMGNQQWQWMGTNWQPYGPTSSCICQSSCIPFPPHEIVGPGVYRQVSGIAIGEIRDSCCRCIDCPSRYGATLWRWDGSAWNVYSYNFGASFVSCCSSDAIQQQPAHSGSFFNELRVTCCKVGSCTDASSGYAIYRLTGCEVRDWDLRTNNCNTGFVPSPPAPVGPAREPFCVPVDLATCCVPVVPPPPVDQCLIFQDNFNDATITGWTQTSGTWVETTEMTTSSTSAKLTCDTTHPDGVPSHYVTVYIAGNAGDKLRVHVGDHFAEVEIGSSTETGCLRLKTAADVTLTTVRASIAAATLTKLTVAYGADPMTGVSLFSAAVGTEASVSYSVTRGGTSVALGTGSTAAAARFDDFKYYRHHSATWPSCPYIGNACNIMADSFDRADNTNVGCSWSESAGDWSISANRLSVSSSTSKLICNTTHPLNTPSHYVTVKIEGQTGDEIRVHVGTNHFAQVTIGSPNGCLALYDGAGTLLTKMRIDAPPSYSKLLQVWYGVTPVADGAESQLTACYNETDVIRYNVTRLGTSVALGTGTVTGAVKFDDFAYYRHYSTAASELSCPYPAALGCTILTDDFTRGNNSDIGCSWSESSDVFSITDNNLVVSTGSATASIETIHPQAAGSHAITAAFQTSQVGNVIRVYTDVAGNSYGQLTVDNPGTLKAFVNGTEVGSVVVTTGANQPYSMQVIHADGKFCVYLFDDSTGTPVYETGVCNIVAAQPTGPIKGGVGVGTTSGTTTFYEVTLERGIDDLNPLCPTCDDLCVACTACEDGPFQGDTLPVTFAGATGTTLAAYACNPNTATPLVNATFGVPFDKCTDDFGAPHTPTCLGNLCGDQLWFDYEDLGVCPGSGSPNPCAVGQSLYPGFSQYVSVVFTGSAPGPVSVSVSMDIRVCGENASATFTKNVAGFPINCTNIGNIPMQGGPSGSIQNLDLSNLTCSIP